MQPCAGVVCLSPLRLRRTSLAVVAGFLVLTHLVFREAEARASAQYLLVTTLGYGHLLGSLLGSRREARSSLLARACAAVAISLGYVLYREAVLAWPGLAVALLALSVWHFTENDLALAAALRTDARPGPLELGVRAQALPVAAAAAIVAAARLASPDPGLLGDLFAATTLFHLVGWLAFLVARGASPWRLLALHTPAFALGGFACASPAAAPWLREWLFSPPLYLYWASLHVAHTLVRRGVARAARPPAPCLRSSTS